MAKYCFYCGRELKDGERCDCRTGRQRSASGYDPAFHRGSSSGPTSQDAGTTSSADTSTEDGWSDRATGNSTNTRTETGGRHSRNRTAGRDESAGSDGSERPRGARYRQTAGRGPRGFGRFRQGVGRGAGRFSRWIHRGSGRPFIDWIQAMLVGPLTFVRKFRLKKPRKVAVVLILLEGILGGFLAAGIFQRSGVAQMLRFGAMGGFFDPDPIPSFFFGLVLSLLSYVIKTLYFMLFARAVIRLKLSFSQALLIQIPATFYTIVLMTAATITAYFSFLQTMMLVIMMFIVRVFVDSVAIREYSGVDENRSITCVFFVYLLFFMTLSLCINLMFPDLENFNANAMEQMFRRGRLHG